MSSDTSPPSGYRLEDPARTAGAAGGAAGGTSGAKPGGPVPAAPSWVKVIATTLRLWWRRRILRVPDSRQIGTVRRAVALAVLIVVIAAGATVTAVALTGSHTSAVHGQHAAVRPKLTPAQEQARATAAAQTAANGTAAAAWIAVQVSGQAVIGCDPGMCAAILADGHPGGGQLVLGPGVSLPASGSLVIATPAVRSQYGPELASTAPEVIAVFGTGAEAVQVRVSMAGGKQAYSQATAGALAARRRAGRQLIGDSRVHVHGAARQDLSAGLVDARLTTVLHRLAAHYRVEVSHFSDSGPLAGIGVPFRLVEIVGLTGARGKHQASEVASVERLLRRQPASYRAALTLVRLTGGRYGLKIEFPAPSPF